jgi:hypothetical protein
LRIDNELLWFIGGHVLCWRCGLQAGRLSGALPPLACSLVFVVFGFTVTLTDKSRLTLTPGSTTLEQVCMHVKKVMATGAPKARK